MTHLTSQSFLTDRRGKTVFRAIQLDADVNVLRPLLSPASENGVVGALACEALEHWLAAGVEVSDVAVGSVGRGFLLVWTTVRKKSKFARPGEDD